MLRLVLKFRKSYYPLIYQVTEGLGSDDRDQSDGWKDYADDTTGSQCWPATDHEKSILYCVVLVILMGN